MLSDAVTPYTCFAQHRSYYECASLSQTWGKEVCLDRMHKPPVTNDGCGSIVLVDGPTDSVRLPPDRVDSDGRWPRVLRATIRHLATCSNFRERVNWG